MPEIITLISVFVVGVIASFIGATVGGGGLLSIPFLIFLGLPPQIAIATNKMGAVGLSLGAIPKFWKAKHIQWQYVPLFSAAALLGAYLGANILLNLNEELLTKIVGVIIVLMLPLLFLRKELGIKRTETSKTKKAIGYLLYILVAVFGGFFGGGAGTLIFYVFMVFYGLTIIEANATGTVPWFLLSLAGFIIFAFHGLINYPIGIALFLGMLVGGRMGAHTAIKKGNQWVKILFTIIVIISGIKLLFF